MSKQSLVSVVMTVFKRTDYLEEAIQSVLSQTFSDFELIVTDDANIESARKICAGFNDPRLRYRSNQKILGAPLNIAAALKEAKGDYIVLFNDDDVMEPDMLALLLPNLQKNPECIVSFGDHWMMDSTGAFLNELTEKNSRACGRAGLPEGAIAEKFNFAIRSGFSFVMGTMFRKSAYQDDWMVADVAGAYDTWLSVRFSLVNGDFYYVPKRLMRWRVHGNSESARLDPEKAKCGVFFFESLLLLDVPKSSRSYLKRQLGRSLFVLGRDQLYFDQTAPARRSFWLSFRKSPTLKSGLGLISTFLPLSLTKDILRRFRKPKTVNAFFMF